jgi:hypothetical protein
MQIQDSVWQGSFGYWQNLFINQNILSIGYAAWNGFLTQGRGLAICDVDLQHDTAVDWRCDPVNYHLQYIPAAKCPDYLQQIELESDVIPNLLQILATYDPNRSIVLLLTGKGQIDINLLQQLAMSPAECYEHVCQRWLEFQLVVSK